MSSKPLVVVAMSGGVDSSVSAALLMQQGYPITGVMMNLWSEPGTECDNLCCTPQAVIEARQAAEHLGFPFHELNASQPFQQYVLQYFLNEYASGTTPNPCMVCNQHIKWGFLMNHVHSLGAEYLATGHYARIRQTPEGIQQLLRAVDQQKDQSYVMSLLTQEQLAHTLFPLGGYLKTEVRQMAYKFGLAVAEKKDSQDLCFVTDRDLPAFLKRNAPSVVRPGKIMNTQGKVLGEHNGLAFYTIGQRKGIGIAAPEALYVLKKDIQTNTLIVGYEHELGKSKLAATQLNWIAGVPPRFPCRLQVKIRYKADFAWGTLYPAGEDLHLEFDHPLRDITPGQFAVFYDGEIVLGGGIIRS